MRINPYLNFDGNGAEAMAFYADIFGVPAQIMRFGDAPGGSIAPGAEDRLLHGVIELANVSIMASDTMPGMPAVRGNNFSLSVNLDSHEEQDRIFAALSAGGTVGQELQEAFFGRWGHLTDRYGIQWMVVVQPAQA